MLTFAEPNVSAISLKFISNPQFEEWRATAAASMSNWCDAQGFTAAPGQICLIPGDTGSIDLVLVGHPSDNGRARFALAEAAAKLPEGTYEITSQHSPDEMDEHALGWLLSQYCFNRYNDAKPHRAGLICPKGVDAKKIEAIANGKP